MALNSSLTCYQPYNIGGQSLACYLFKHTPDEVLLGFPKLGAETQDCLSLLWGNPLTLSSLTLTFSILSGTRYVGMTSFALASGGMEFWWEEEWLYVGSIY